MSTDNLLVELFVEELPPKALKKLGESFAEGVQRGLSEHRLLEPGSAMTWFATPRRLAVHLTQVRSVAPDSEINEKLMPVSVALGADGKPSAALRKRLDKLGRGVLADRWPDAADGPDKLYLASDGKVDAVYFRSLAAGQSLPAGLSVSLDDALCGLPIPKVMTYQLADGWTDVKFVRPAHGLVALHGGDVVPIQALGLQAGRITHGHRFEAAADAIEIAHADAYAETLEAKGAVMASFAVRRAEIARQLAAAAAKVGGGVKAIDDDALLDEVTALVERPNVLVCEFEREFLDVPQECLILTMKANQKYFPLLDAAGKLTNKFLVVSNITPSDAGAVIQGNERVVRPRLADAKFFFDQDRKRTLASRVDALGKVVYHNKLGTQGERVERVRAIARVIARQLGDATLVAQADQAALLAKTDLVTDMVGEFPELQGTMGRYYALNDGLPEAVANAIEDHYKPRFAYDNLPRDGKPGKVGPGVVVALADKLETLVGMFGIGNLPTGEKDPFALRRHALGVLRMLIILQLPLNLPEIMEAAAQTFGALLPDPKASNEQLLTFIYERVSGLLHDQGYSAQEADAVIAARPPWGAMVHCLNAVRAFAALPEAQALAAANKRI